MPKRILLTAILALSILPAGARKKEQPPDPAWAGITARGRMLAEYDAASRHASDALKARNPDKGSVAGYLAMKSASGWVVALGRFNDTHDKFLVAYLATQGKTPEEFKIVQNTPPGENTGFFYLAARATVTARLDFHGEKRPYNYAVLPADSNQMYVYIYPAQTTPGIYPLGGDVRYLISPDGTTVVEKRQLHKTIMEINYSTNSTPGKIAGGYHVHVLSDVPEDTDVFYVLTRKPSMPEYVRGGKRIYKVHEDGTIVAEK